MIPALLGPPICDDTGSHGCHTYTDVVVTTCIYVVVFVLVCWVFWRFRWWPMARLRGRRERDNAEIDALIAAQRAREAGAPPPSEDEMWEHFAPPPSEDPMWEHSASAVSREKRTGTGIRIHRAANAYVDRRRKYRIVVDGEEVGSVRRGETIDIPLDPGRHSAWLTIDWTGSETATFVLEEGETIEYVCRPRYPGVAIHVGLFRSIQDRDDWVALERI